MRVLQLFVSETRKNWLQEYFASVSRGAPTIETSKPTKWQTICTYLDTHSDTFRGKLARYV